MFGFGSPVMQKYMRMESMFISDPVAKAAVTFLYDQFSSLQYPLILFEKKVYMWALQRRGGQAFLRVIM